VWYYARFCIGKEQICIRNGESCVTFGQSSSSQEALLRKKISQFFGSLLVPKVVEIKKNGALILGPERPMK
jgi:hypothetical protein